jgi:hypothetical protein
VDPSGNLYVADSDNARVLEYNAPFAGCGSFPCVGGPSNLVFGQGGNFNTNSCDGSGVSASSLCFPVGVAVDNHGNLFVVDQDDNRVFEYNTPLATDTVADEVFGQGGSFSSTIQNKGGFGASALNGPSGIALDLSGDLYIADSSNNRVLEYSSPHTSATANQVFGQGGSFTSTTCNSDTSNSSISSANHLCLSGFGGGIASDGSGNLYVADSGNNRASSTAPR